MQNREIYLKKNWHNSVDCYPNKIVVPARLLRLQFLCLSELQYQWWQTECSCEYCCAAWNRGYRFFCKLLNQPNSKFFLRRRIRPWKTWSIRFLKAVQGPICRKIWKSPSTPKSSSMQSFVTVYFISCLVKYKCVWHPISAACPNLRTMWTLTARWNTTL